MKWTRTLYARLAMGLIIILLSVGAIYTVSVIYLARQWQQTATQDLNRHLARNLVADKRIVHDGKIDIDAMKKTFMEYMTINPSIEIYYLDLDGKILSYSADPGKVKRTHVNLEPIRKFLSGTTMLPLLGDDPRAHGRQKTFSVTPLPNAGNPEGYLYVVLRGEDLNAAEQAQTLQFVLAVATPGLIGSLLLGFLIGLLIFRHLSLRLRALATRVGAFADSGYQRPAALVDSDSRLSRDEIDDLEKAFSKMSQHIASQWAALKQQDQLRREMIASISHDLRTPLASARGYLETIALKKDKLDEADKARYLDIAIKQTNRLQTLIDQLFELVKLEARDTELHFENFPVLELVYDVVGKFSLKAQQKNIELAIDPEAIDSHVVADIGLIERVLDNLIDNALEHTPQGHGIWIEVSENSNKQVVISVNDEGEGIPKNQQQLIFDRFHRANNPQRSSSGHAGLGLAIVKKIIELHQQSITVESSPGEGARFSFTLAAE